MLKKSDIEQKLISLRAECGSEDEVYEAYMNEVSRFAEGEDEPYFALSDYHCYYNEQARKITKQKKSAHKTLDASELVVATQFFTPLALVKYLADNIISRLIGCDNGGYSDIIGDLGAKLELNSIKNLRIYDPAVGTGNILYYVSRVLKDIYMQLGVEDSEIPKYIANNIVGCDIDKTAIDFCKRELRKSIGAEPCIYCLKVPSKNLQSLLVLYNQTDLLIKLMELPMVGSLQVFDESSADILHRILLDISDDTTNIKAEITEYIAVIAMLNAKYDAIIMNPPYLASSDYNRQLAAFIDTNYIENRQDLFSVFIARGVKMLQRGGYLGVVCPFNWMFIKQFTSLRQQIIDNYCIHNLARLHISSYKSARVFLSAFVLGDSLKNGVGSYLELSSEKDSGHGIARAIATGEGKFITAQQKFTRLPNNIIAYWHSDKFYEALALPKLTEYMDIRQGMATGDNKKYLLKITDVKKSDIDCSATNLAEFIKGGKKYALYSKGGKFKKWYGNIDYVIKFTDKYRDIYAVSGNKLPSKAYYFKSGITWTLVSSKGVFGARIVDNSVFDVGGSCGFPKNPEDRYVILAYLCSVVASTYLNTFNPTMNCQVGDLKKLPYVAPSGAVYEEIDRLSRENVSLTKANYEQSCKGKVNKKALPAVKRKVAQNERRLNEIFIDLYGLQGDLSPEVEDRLITLES
ncbi:MAG: Eco57I restriction-modification methylase domain-containing protein [Bacillota bacterium]